MLKVLHPTSVPPPASPSHQQQRPTPPPSRPTSPSTPSHLTGKAWRESVGLMKDVQFVPAKSASVLGAGIEGKFKPINDPLPVAGGSDMDISSDAPMGDGEDAEYEVEEPTTPTTPLINGIGGKGKEREKEDLGVSLTPLLTAELNLCSRAAVSQCAHTRTTSPLAGFRSDYTHSRSSFISTKGFIVFIEETAVSARLLVAYRQHQCHRRSLIICTPIADVSTTKTTATTTKRSASRSYPVNLAWVYQDSHRTRARQPSEQLLPE